VDLRFANIPAGEIGQLRHPLHLIRHAEADTYYFENFIKS